MHRYEVAGGQHYFLGVKAAIKAKGHLQKHSNLQAIKGEIYAMGWINVIQKAIADGATPDEAAAAVANGAELTIPEKLELKDLTVQIAIATLVSEHNEVADLHKALTQEQIIRYMRNVWQRSHPQADQRWSSAATVPREDLRAVCVFTGLQAAAVSAKIAVAMADDESWSLVETIWKMHKEFKLLGQKQPKAPKTKKQNPSNPAVSRTLGPKHSFNTRHLEDIFSLPWKAHIPYVLKNLVERIWAPTQITAECIKLRSISRLADYFVESVSWDFDNKRIRDGVENTWDWLADKIPNVCNSTRLRSVYEVGYRNQQVPKSSCRSDVADMSKALRTRMNK